MLIYDAMYTDEEYHNPKAPKIGWGHSTWQEGVKLVKAANVKTLVVFHHDPNHSDDFLDELVPQVQAAHENSVLAREGLTLTL
jgi:ribonuclease BN (tRNA processing enzyme)